jgi:hypothetical protein
VNRTASFEVFTVRACAILTAISRGSHAPGVLTGTLREVVVPAGPGHASGARAGIQIL